MADDTAPQRPNYRDGKNQVGVYLPQDAVFTFRELLLKLSRERSRRVTSQEAVAEALQDYAKKHGVELKIS